MCVRHTCMNINAHRCEKVHFLFEKYRNDLSQVVKCDKNLRCGYNSLIPVALLVFLTFMLLYSSSGVRVLVKTAVSLIYILWAVRIGNTRNLLLCQSLWLHLWIIKEANGIVWFQHSGGSAIIWTGLYECVIKKTFSHFYSPAAESISKRQVAKALHKPTQLLCYVPTQTHIDTFRKLCEADFYVNSAQHIFPSKQHGVLFHKEISN